MTAMALKEEIEHAINRASAENGSNTPDFILAEYLVSCLTAFDVASRSREKWFGVELQVGQADGTRARRSEVG